MKKLDEKMLAIVIGTCDKHSFLWDGWWHYFNKNWNFNYPVYFLNEKKDAPFPVKQIKVDIPDVNLWTKRIRESINQIPENDIFFMPEDIFITSKFKDFKDIYRTFKVINADALRIEESKCKWITTHNTLFKINGTMLKKLDSHSRYLIAYSPNIWKKSFILECLKYNGSIWHGETIGSNRIKGKNYNIYSYIKPNWYSHACIKGNITKEGKKLMNKTLNYK